jgi:hypothetical protein
MQIALPIDRPSIVRNVLSSAAGRDERSREDDRFDVSRQPLPTELAVGDTVYRSRSGIIGVFLPGHIGAQGKFAVPELVPYFVGRGRNFEQGFADWLNQVHSRFQDLYYKRPFEMTREEAEVWAALESVIDVPAYKIYTPLRIRQAGKVVGYRAYPERIEWEDGQKESVRLDQMPGQFAAYKAGQPFEAVVLRDPVDFRLIRVTDVRRTSGLPMMKRDEFDGLISRIPTTASLPDADWD